MTARRSNEIAPDARDSEPPAIALVPTPGRLPREVYDDFEHDDALPERTRREAEAQWSGPCAELRAADEAIARRARLLAKPAREPSRSGVFALETLRPAKADRINAPRCGEREKSHGDEDGAA